MQTIATHPSIHSAIALIIYPKVYYLHEYEKVSKEVLDVPGARVTGGCERPDVGAGN